MNILRHNYVLLVSMLAIVWLFSQCEEVDDTTCPACPVVTAIQPTSGKAFETATISGRNFGGFSTTLDQVTIDGVALIPIETQSFTDTEMQFMLPAELANGNTAPMTVRINIGNLTSDEGEGSQKVFFTYAYPVINELIPEHGRVGDLITIKGENFDTIPANNVVRFAGVKAQVESATTSELTVTVPQGVKTGNVQLNLHGFSVDGPVFSFNTVVAEELIPNHGRAGDVLMVKGAFFNTEELLKNQVTFGEFEGEVIDATDSTLQVIIPGGATSGEVTITVDGVTAAQTFDFTYDQVQVTQLVPKTAREGEVITIKGAFFLPEPTQNRVTINGVVAEVTTATDSTLQVVVPVGADTGPVVVTADDFTAENKPQFRYAKVAITELVPNNGRRGETIRIRGQFFGDNANAVSVKFGDLVAQITSIMDTLIAVTVPEGADDSQVSVIVEDRQADTLLDFVYNKVQINSLQPAEAAFGESIQIVGEFFSTVPDSNQVVINGSAVTVLEATEIQLSVEIPKGVGSGDVVVTVDQRTADQQPAFSYRLTPVVTTLAGQARVSGSTNGDTASATFTNPKVIGADSKGNIFVADASFAIPSRIRKINTQQGVVSTFAGSTEQGYQNGVGEAARFSNIQGMAIDGNDNLFLAESENHVIRKVDRNATVELLAGDHLQRDTIDGDRFGARFSRPNDVAIDSQGNIFVADLVNNRIRKITPAGRVSTIFRADNTDFLVLPQSLAISRDGTIYSTFRGRAGVYQINMDSTITLIAGNTREAGDRDGTGTQARFGVNPIITMGLDGFLYIADPNNNKIRKMNLDTQEVTAFVGSGVPGANDGLGATAEFREPIDIVQASERLFYVADMSNHLIRKITLE